MPGKKLLHDELTGEILRVAFDISNELGSGFLEKVYENAMVVGLRESGLKVAQQVPVRVHYLGQEVGDYIADMIVENAVLVEIKATEKHNPVYVAQTLNYLKATGLEVGAGQQPALKPNGGLRDGVCGRPSDGGGAGGWRCAPCRAIASNRGCRESPAP